MSIKGTCNYNIKTKDKDENNDEDEKETRQKIKSVNLWIHMFPFVKKVFQKGLIKNVTKIFFFRKYHVRFDASPALLIYK